jgi:hypothetical protein
VFLFPRRQSGQGDSRVGKSSGFLEGVTVSRYFVEGVTQDRRKSLFFRRRHGKMGAGCGSRRVHDLLSPVWLATWAKPRDRIFGLLDYWNTCAKHDSLFHNSLLLSHLLSRNIYKSRRIRERVCSKNGRIRASRSLFHNSMR